MKIRDIVIIGLLSAILIIVQVTLSFLPNVELVTTLIILYTLLFGRKTLYIISVFILVEGLIYGIGLWWFNYLYIWFVLYGIVRLLRKNRSPLVWAIVAGCFGFTFGALCSIPYFITGGIPTGMAYWVAGIPYDVIHGISNFFIALIAFLPFLYIMKNLKTNYYEETNTHP